MVDLTSFPLSKTGLAAARGQSRMVTDTPSPANGPTGYQVANVFSNAQTITEATLRALIAGLPASAKLVQLAIRVTTLGTSVTLNLGGGVTAMAAGELFESAYTGNAISTAGFSLVLTAGSVVRVQATFA